MPSGLLHFLNQCSPGPWSKTVPEQSQEEVLWATFPPSHYCSQLTLQALCLHTEAILTTDLKA